ncbi:VOC family protein [Myxococcus sp. CA040A]|uniref:VOC family protein n=1 Tax=Myxococcus sp. CA040A TaxID=2741738 RepID=UPI00157B1995|nr:VOC family protein [Myxococcus sp. CA040A]NTX03029.1 VOC family protein [Myxococcus sp. CA040A]
MTKVPEGCARITPGLFYVNAPAAIDWLERAFGFQTRLKVEGGPGVIVHSELVFGEGVIMLSSLSAKYPGRTPTAAGGTSAAYLMLYVDDVDAHCARAKAAGAKITREPETTNYGDDYWTDRGYGAEDLEGHAWWFAQRMKG